MRSHHNLNLLAKGLGTICSCLSVSAKYPANQNMFRRGRRTPEGERNARRTSFRMLEQFKVLDEFGGGWKVRVVHGRYDGRIGQL